LRLRADAVLGFVLASVVGEPISQVEGSRGTGLGTLLRVMKVKLSGKSGVVSHVLVHSLPKALDLVAIVVLHSIRQRHVSGDSVDLSIGELVRVEAVADVLNVLIPQQHVVGGTRGRESHVLELRLVAVLLPSPDEFAFVREERVLSDEHTHRGIVVVDVDGRKDGSVIVHLDDDGVGPLLRPGLVPLDRRSQVGRDCLQGNDELVLHFVVVDTLAVV